MPHTHHKVLWNSCLQKIVSHGDFWKHFRYCLALNGCPYSCFSPVLDLRHLHKLLPGSGRKEEKILKMAAVQMIYILWIATRQARAQVLIFILVSQLPLSLSALSSSERWQALLVECCTTTHTLWRHLPAHCCGKAVVLTQNHSWQLLFDYTFFLCTIWGLGPVITLY